MLSFCAILSECGENDSRKPFIIFLRKGANTAAVSSDVGLGERDRRNCESRRVPRTGGPWGEVGLAGDLEKPG